jgi:hypothetical protein
MDNDAREYRDGTDESGVPEDVHGIPQADGDATPVSPWSPVQEGDQFGNTGNAGFGMRFGA